MKLTKKQKTLVDFVDNFIKQHDYSPSYREIMRGLGYKSVSTVAAHIENLVKIGALTKEDGAIRSVELTKENSEKDRAVRFLRAEIARFGEESENAKKLKEAIRILENS